MIFFAPERWCCKIKVQLEESWIYYYWSDNKKKDRNQFVDLRSYIISICRHIFDPLDHFSVFQPHVGALRPIWNESKITDTQKKKKKWKLLTTKLKIVFLFSGIVRNNFVCRTIWYNFTFALWNKYRKRNKNREKKFQKLKKKKIYRMNYIVREYERAISNGPRSTVFHDKNRTTHTERWKCWFVVMAVARVIDTYTLLIFFFFFYLP